MNYPPTSPIEDSPHLLKLLDEASELCGMEPEFWDIWGQHHVPSAQVKREILTALGIPCDSVAALENAITSFHLQQWSHAVPSTLVLTQASPLPLPIRIQEAHLPVTAHVTLTLEDGQSITQSFALADCHRMSHRDIGGVTYLELRANLHQEIPMGYHQLQVALGNEASATCNLIVAPGRAWFPPSIAKGQKAAGVAVSLYGVRSARNWGAGDFTDLEGLLHWVKEDLHCSFLALNPLHSIDNRQPYNTSPYLPNSCYFRNPLYIDIEAVAEFRSSILAQRLLARPSTQALIAELRGAEFVEYERVWRLKRLFLTILFRQFLKLRNEPSQKAFDAYRREQGDRLRLFALYSALWDHLHRQNKATWIWPDWPAEYQDPGTPAVAEFERTHQRQVLFHQYVQWVLDTQLGIVQNKAKAMGLIGLYHDLALAVDKCGADLWAYRSYFVAGCRVGSPPDGFAPEGQDWAFPPPNSIRHRQDGYRLFIDSIRANSRHGGALRMDHVMRLFRLYWIPNTMSAKSGAYVRDFSEDLLRILALESHRGKFFCVGEDLGTVADHIRHSLTEFNILGCKVFYFEKDPAGRFRRPEEYVRQALVSSTTHDLATLAGFWIHRDIEARKAAGLLPDEASYQRQLAERAVDKQRMLDVLHESNLLPPWFPRDASVIPELTGELHNAVIGFLVRTPCSVIVLNQEDLTKETEQQNLPASTWQYPNWRRKMMYTLEQLRRDKLPQDFAAMFRHWLSQAN